MRRAEPPEDIDQLRKLGYESRDVAMRPLLKAGIYLAIFALASAALTILIYIAFVPERGVKPSMQLPPNQPPLQTDVTRKRDMKEMLQEQEKVLTTYGWVDEQRGIARIPIDRAIDLIAERGLPTRPGGTRPEGEAPVPEPPTVQPTPDHGATAPPDAGHSQGTTHE